MTNPAPRTAEHVRLEEDASRTRNWKRWGPYLAERQWGTVREDYSADGEAWKYFTFEQAAGRAYRWGEDGLLGITDRECRLCFALALWNGRDPILKERLFGLAGPEGNHGEDVKEAYFYTASTPTHSHLRAVYHYPQAEFPYARLREENRRRDRGEPEFELEDTGVFAENRYFEVAVEYAKGGPNDILIEITAANRGPEPARLHLLPTLWFRNTWSWGCRHEGCSLKPRLVQLAPGHVQGHHESLGRVFWDIEPGPAGHGPLLFTENETNAQKLFNAENAGPFVKDALQEHLVHGRTGAVNPKRMGTKVAAHRVLDLAPGEVAVMRLRLSAESEAPARPFGVNFAQIFAARRAEAEEFYATVLPAGAGDEERHVARQAFAGLLWSKQFYHFVVEDWLAGDSAQPPPPAARRKGRNRDWPHLFNRDIISMPDKWEYPWFAAWDLAFHMIPFARIDPHFAKEQLNLFLREWYMHPSGQIPAYEWNFSDVNPPVHAWACWRVYKMTGPRGGRDRLFLARVFQKLVVNFTWCVNRKDPSGRHLFSGGFLGLDNIGVFDRSKPLPTGGHLEQADGTAWMAFYCGTMLAISLELAEEDPAYEDIASKFFEHFVAIADAMNHLGGAGLWHEEDGFYYDQLLLDGKPFPLRLRSLVGIIPLFAVEFIDDAQLKRLPGFVKRTRWFLENRRDLAPQISYMIQDQSCAGLRLLAIPSRERLQRVLRYVFDEKEFLSPYGVRSLSKVYGEQPFTLQAGGQEYRVEYVPGESDSGLFGGNSNWRGPVWFPTKFLLMEALERYHHFYGDSFLVEFPTGSGRMINLKSAAQELSRRLVKIFVPSVDGQRPCHGNSANPDQCSRLKDMVLFHEYFHGETGRGLGASHQTGWTALVVRLIETNGAEKRPN
ncbi:MAG: glucosidase [Opitutae bacterium]|nr:glucosidase [Opitutae bacterium]